MYDTLTLHDGRTLEYADLGDPAGVPVLLFPGTPATAGQGAMLAEASRTHGVRLVATSRPGYAASTVAPPGLTPTAVDAVELLDRLGMDEVVAMGLSGGAPYSLALAALAPSRVSGVHVLGGPGDHAEVNPDGLDEEDLRAIELRTAGDIDGAWALMAASAERSFGPMQAMTDAEFHAALLRTRPPGRNWLDEHPDLSALFEADFRRAITPADGVVRDNLSWLGPWDFDLTTVAAPVRLVHGDDDLMVPRAHGDWLHERLPTSQQYVVPGGHGHATFGAAIETFAAIGRA